MSKKLFIFSFFMTAFPLALAGMDALDQGKIIFGSVYLVCGLVYMYLALVAAKKHLDENIWIMLFGTLILLIVGLDYLLQGKTYLPYAYLGAALISFLPVLVKKIKRNNQTKT
jgi:drug/metabolite transporter (DMT)-like permease